MPDMRETGRFSAYVGSILCAHVGSEEGDFQEKDARIGKGDESSLSWFQILTGQ